MSGDQGEPVRCHCRSDWGCVSCASHSRQIHTAYERPRSPGGCRLNGPSDQILTDIIWDTTVLHLWAVFKDCFAFTKVSCILPRRDREIELKRRAGVDRQRPWSRFYWHGGRIPVGEPLELAIFPVLTTHLVECVPPNFLSSCKKLSKVVFAP